MQSIDQATQKYLLAIHRRMGLTFPRYKKLKTFFKNNWESVFNAKISDLMSAGIDQKGIEKFEINKKTTSPDAEWEKMQKCETKLLLHGTPEYPTSLENIASPPVLLFCRGEITVSDFPSISVVGSRNISTYGKRALETIVSKMALAKITIVSGLALGADAQAHKIALRDGSRTIAVLGNGLDTIYPAKHATLAREIVEKKQGAILSEFLPGIEARPEHFPIRNRIVAGLSRATIIIEAAMKSGSLITASLANEHGREVFAVPGEIFSKNSEGTNSIISKGEANPALSGEQILEDLGLEKIAIHKQAKQLIPKTKIESEILALFGNEDKRSLDDLIRRSPLPNATVSSTLMILEIKGLIKRLDNQMYARNL